MNTPLRREYFELLKSAREHLSSTYPKGAFILAEKENWEALRRAIVQSKQNDLPPSPKPEAKTPSPTVHTPSSSRGIAQSSTTPAAAPPRPLHHAPQTKPSQPPPEQKRIVEEKIDRSLTLSEPPTPQELDFKGWKEIFNEKFPQISLVEPTQAKAKTEASIVIVYEKGSAQEMQFLQNVARTCHLLLGPTALVTLEQFQKRFAGDGGSENKKMVICYGVSVDEAFSLEELSVYIRNPAIKAQLWRQLSTRYMQKSS